LRLCAGGTRLGRTAAGLATVVLLLAGAREPAGYLFLSALGLHLGTVLLDHAGQVHVEEPGFERGLGQFAYTVQWLLGLLVAFWVSVHLGEGRWPEHGFSFDDWMNGVVGTGLLYTLAGILAVVLAVVANPLGSRMAVLQRAGPLFVPLGGGLLVFIGLSGTMPALERWTGPMQQADDTEMIPAQALVALFVAALVCLVILGAMAGCYGLLLYGKNRFDAHRFHPVLPPIMDLLVAAAGGALLLYDLFMFGAGVDRGRAVQQGATVVLLVSFAVVDLRVQKRRLVMQ
jgi:hypothetical protein